MVALDRATRVAAHAGLAASAKTLVVMVDGRRWFGRWGTSLPASDC